VKNIIYLLVIALFIGGCSYKNQPIALQSYEANYHGEISKENKTVYISKVKDLRANKRNIGYTLQNGEKDISLFSDINFEKKYKDALLYALNIAEFNTATNAEDAALLVEIYIKKIELVYTDKNFEENLKGEINIEVVVKNGKTTSRQNFKQKAGKWIAPSYDSKDFEPFLTTLFSDNIDNIVSKLAEI